MANRGIKAEHYLLHVINRDIVDPAVNPPLEP